MSWRLHVRELFWRQPTGPRHIFTERRPGLAAPWARRTLRLTARRLAMGLALGGAAGARLSLSGGLPGGRATLLRLIRRAPGPAISPPQTLSGDDFALRERHTDGTLLLALERRRPVALLPDRASATVAQWLRA
jgi:transposase